jgi:hypothetical protein
MASITIGVCPISKSQTRENRWEKGERQIPIVKIHG